MIYLADLLAATGGILPHGATAEEFQSFAFDSRQVEAGQLFMATKTDRGDGHDFIEAAIQQGAVGILCEHYDYTAIHITVIIVPDSQQAMRDYASYILKKYQPKVIGVTGSNGKTTTKEAIALILQTRYRVFKNYRSYNGRYGLPIALGQLQSDHQIAVLEMASDSFGEIAELVRIAPPDVGVITTINQSHLARLGTLDNVALEKGRLIDALSFNGAAILNADDARVANMVPRTKGRILTFGFRESADVYASQVTLDREGMSFKIHYQGKSYPGRTKLLGRHQMYPLLAAVTTALVFDISPAEAVAAIAPMPRILGRMNLLPGRNGTVIIDDTFSSSPEAVTAALETLMALPGATKVAILGDMPELGDFEEEAHRDIGAYISKLPLQRLVTKGEAAQWIAKEARAGQLGKRAVAVTYTNEDAATSVEDLLSPETVILVKGGAEVQLEQAVQRLLANPEIDRHKLVRQEEGWQKPRFRQPARPTWIEIDLEAVANNVRRLVEIVAPAKIMAVLKADAYGHGMAKIARTVLNNGASWVGVATLGEALTLRGAGLDVPILVMSYMPAWQAHEAIAHNIRATVFSLELARAFSRAAADLNETAYIHIKVDSGMGRLGLLPSEVLPFLQTLSRLPGLRVEGMYTHFGTADEADLSYAREQLRRYQELLAQLDEAGLRPPIIHAANTAALINLPEARFDMVRPGVGIYGLRPSADLALPEGFRPSLTFKSTVGQVKTLPPNSPVGYGAIYWTKDYETVAIIPVGYADGFRRGPQTWGEVLVKGQRAPIVGRVSMDQCAINITHIPNVRQGDEVVLIGQQGHETITVEEVAARLGTINYEVVSELLARIPRVS